jgi:hypothetical protein
MTSVNGDTGDSELDEDFVDDSFLSFLRSDAGDEPTNNNVSDASEKWSDKVMKLMGKGELNKALEFLNLCLPHNPTTGSKDKSLPEGLQSGCMLPESEEIKLLEKRCLLLMKLKCYDKVWDDARRLLEKKPNHSLAFKCLLASLCKRDQVCQLLESLTTLAWDFLVSDFLPGLLL